MLCPHCEEEIETVEHCFLKCSRVVEGWNKVFKWWNMGNFNIGSVQDIISHNGNNSLNLKQKVIWQVVCWSMLYLVWCSRNKRVFENKVSNLTTICDELQVVTFFWIANRSRGAISSWFDWCSDPSKACKS